MTAIHTQQDGPALLLIHGTAASLRTWDPLVPVPDPCPPRRPGRPARVRAVGAVLDRLGVGHATVGKLLLVLFGDEDLRWRPSSADDYRGDPQWTHERPRGAGITMYVSTFPRVSIFVRRDDSVTSREQERLPGGERTAGHRRHAVPEVTRIATTTGTDPRTAPGVRGRRRGLLVRGAARGAGTPVRAAARRRPRADLGAADHDEGHHDDHETAAARERLRHAGGEADPA
ncbi:hypothetical protein JCM33774_46530 [Actinophytocola sp. KF-1]